MGGPADSPDAARLARAQALLADAERALADAERRAAQVEVTGLERDEARAEADELATRLEVAEADNGKLLEQLEVARRIQDDMLASVSWRVTKPLRAAKDRARR